jgi:hypothetical protein
MSAVNSPAISTTNSDKTISAFATLRFVGDALDSDEISEALKQKPKRAYRKGETYRSGPRSPELIGKTGLWYFTTYRVPKPTPKVCSVSVDAIRLAIRKAISPRRRRAIPSKDLRYHLDEIICLTAPLADGDKRLRTLREIMERKILQAHVTCFWRSCPGVEKASIPSVATEAFARLGAGFETDFGTEDEPPHY